MHLRHMPAGMTSSSEHCHACRYLYLFTYWLPTVLLACSQCLVSAQRHTRWPVSYEPPLDAGLTKYLPEASQPAMHVFQPCTGSAMLSEKQVLQ